MLAVFLSRILGLLRDRFLAGAFFDAANSWQLDAYFAAFRLPDMIFQLLVVGALSAAFIPVFSDYLIKQKNQAWYLASSVINLGLLLFLFLGALVVIFAPQFSRLIAPNFPPHQLKLMTDLTRVLVVAQFSFLVSNFLTGILQSHQYFLIPALSPLAYNLGIIFGIIFLAPFLGIYGPALGVIIGSLLHLLVQVPLTFKLGFHYYPVLDFSHPGVRRIGRLMLPRALALAVNQIELTFAVFLATSLPAGSLAIFYFAQHLNSLPVGLFGATIGQAVLPSLSQNASRQTLVKFKTLLVDSVNQVLYLSLPAGMMLLILRIPIVRLAFGTRNFPWEATLLTGKVVALFAVSVFAQSVVQVFVRGFYALSNTRLPLFLAILAVAANISFSLLFVYYFKLGVLGLAAAISLASFIQAAGLFYFLYLAVGGFTRRELLYPFIKMSLATIITGVCLWIPLRVLDLYLLNTTKTFDLIILTLLVSFIGLAVFVVLSLVLKIKELDSFLTVIRKLVPFKTIIEPLPPQS